MRSVAHDLTRLDPFDEDGVLRMVVETPRGAGVKVSHFICAEPKKNARRRALPPGLVG